MQNTATVTIKCY